jgi:predicted nucleic acid-binding protein
MDSEKNYLYDLFSTLNDARKREEELVRSRVDSIFTLMYIGNMTLTEINTLTEEEASLLAERFLDVRREEISMMYE